MFSLVSKILLTVQLSHRNRLKSPYLLQLAMNMLNNQIKGDKVFSTWK